MSNEAADDRTHKAKYILKTVLAKVAAVRSPGATVVIDKSIASFRGSFTFNQYIPG